MRQKRTPQGSLFEPNPVDHPFAEDMERASAFLDAPRNDTSALSNTLAIALL